MWVALGSPFSKGERRPLIYQGIHDPGFISSRITEVTRQEFESWLARTHTVWMNVDRNAAYTEWLAGPYVEWTKHSDLDWQQLRCIMSSDQQSSATGDPTEEDRLYLLHQGEAFDSLDSRERVRRLWPFGLWETFVRSPRLSNAPRAE